MSSTNRWIFREGRSSAPGETVRAGLVDALARLCAPTRDRIIDALLRAGELETALADAASEDACIATEITQALAGALVGSPATSLPPLATVARQMRIPEALEIAAPEGFAYYALHPLAYARMLDLLPSSGRMAQPRLAVIGIRSIGSTLSAVVTAALARKNIRADRITVRPVGHPYDRKTHFTAAQLHWIAGARQEQAEFLVVDEGPGLSGSSFLSVGEALVRVGVEPRRISFLCGHEVYPETLVTPNGAERWRGFRSYAAPGHRPPAEDLIDVGAGKWRVVFPTHRAHEFGRSPQQGGAMREAPDPVPSWIQMERAKFLSVDGRGLFKFVGLGRFGEEVGLRAAALAACGFGPEFFGIVDGYGEYGMLGGAPVHRHDLSPAVIERMADYCAMRATEFRVSKVPGSPLDAMARFNYEEEFGAPAPWELLDTRQAVICDGRMPPHEWVRDADGRLRKTDGDMHGDDHFLPGPVDIAWDLAGAIVEWEMDTAAEELFLRRFTTRSGDDPRPRVESYVLAYGACRTAFCRMGAAATGDNEEQARLVRAADRIREFILNREPNLCRVSRALPAGRAALGDPLAGCHKL